MIDFFLTKVSKKEKYFALTTLRSVVKENHKITWFSHYKVERVRVIDFINSSYEGMTKRGILQRWGKKYSI